MAFPIQKLQIVSPKHIFLEINDDDIVCGTLEQLSTPDAGAYNTWLARNGSYAYVVGPDKKHLRYQDTPPPAYVDFVAMQVAANWGPVGTRTVVSVGYWNNGLGWYSSGSFNPVRGVSKINRFLLTLSGDLAPGHYTITPPVACNVTAKAFNYTAEHTRCHAIRVNQMGYRPEGGKIAYFSMWAPSLSIDGQSNLLGDYGITLFNILDENNDIVFQGVPTVKLADRASAEATTYYGHAANSSQGPSAATHWVKGDPVPFATVTNISETNPAVVTYSGTDPVEDATVFIDEVRGLTDGSFNIMVHSYLLRAHNVNPTANTFEVQRWQISGGVYQWIPLDASICTGTSINSAFCEYKELGKIYLARTTTNAGTTVHELDFTAYVPSSPGLFRVQIPGFGVSPEFPIDPAAMFRQSRLAAIGAYHQRSGVALDGRHGYTRPKPGDRDAITLYESLCPYMFCSENGGGPILQNYAAFEPYITSTVVDPRGFLGLMDAGDWDIRRTHTISSNVVRLWVDERLTPAQRTALRTGFNIPLASELHSDYIPLNNESYNIHEAIFTLEGPRRTQHADGGVSNGVNIGIAGGAVLSTITGITAANPAVVTYSGTDPGNNAIIKIQSVVGFSNASGSLVNDHILKAINVNTTANTCQLQRWDGAVWTIIDGTTATTSYTSGGTISSVTAGDIADNEPSWLYRGTYYTYFRDHSASFVYATGAATLARILRDRGYTTIAAGWEASAIAAWNFAENLYSNTAARDAHYALTKSAAGWTTPQYDGYMAGVKGGIDIGRAYAAACLFHLTGVTTYRDIFDAFLALGTLDDLYGAEGLACFAYWNANGTPGITAANVTRMTVLFAARSNTIMNNQNQAGVSYRDISLGGAATFGLHFGSCGNEETILLLGHIMSGDANNLKALEAWLGHYLGANQMGLCALKGGGVDNTLCGLHRDSEVNGEPIPDGIGIYGPVYSWALGTFVLNGAGGARLPYHYFKTPDTDMPNSQYHQFIPPTFARPMYEKTFFNPYAIEMMEYTVQQTITPILDSAMYLWAQNSNVETTLAPRRVGTARCVTY